MLESRGDLTVNMDKGNLQICNTNSVSTVRSEGKESEVALYITKYQAIKAYDEVEVKFLAFLGS